MGPRRGVMTRSSSSTVNMVAKILRAQDGRRRLAGKPRSLRMKPLGWLKRAFGGGGIVDLRRDMEQMSIQIRLLQRAVSNAPVVAHDASARLRIPEPKAYGGARDAKEVENFFFDMEQYFFAANVEDEARKVSTTTMYLTGDAKLWWRTKYSEIQNQVRLDTWALLREAIRVQFFPLRKLEHTGSMQDYVKSFSALMLDIQDMSEKDKLFTFMEGLKPWAPLELQRQRVTDLGSAMAAAERLTDFASETRKDMQTTSNPVQNKTGGAKSFRSKSNRGGGDRKPHAQTGSQGSSNRNKPQENRQGAPQRSIGCFLCDGPHRYRDCPKKQLLNALAIFTDKASPAKSVEPQASASGKNGSEEDEDNLGAISQWCNTLSHQVAAKKTMPLRVGKTAPALTGSHPEDETQPRNPRKKGLMFVDVKIHGKLIRAMVDTRATHNYLASADLGPCWRRELGD
ncbi:UNVERIFIED_CONTAM: hypothetical protein Slati_1488600 [Sesamum latifolium]|uniref:Retrotransposon gag domain-containing protein n=1 Tax=Sesamum latifolium TaxID=2727402 RepID=A0AAW2X564_9LAMI